MKRKVNLVGNNTLTVSLPNEWVKRNKINKGDEIDVVENKSNLIFSKNLSSDTESSFKLVINEQFQTDPSFNKEKYLFVTDPRYIEAYLDGLYINGYNKIDVELPKVDTLTHLNHLQLFVKDRLLGYEITNIENNKCKIENVAKVGDEKFNIMLRRLFMMTKKILEDFYDDLKKGELVNLKYHESQITYVNHYSNYCLRVIANKMSGPSAFSLWYIVARMLQLYRNSAASYIGVNKNNSGLKFSKETLELLKAMIEMFDLTYKNFYNYDQLNIKKIYDIFYGVIKPMFQKELFKKQGCETFLWHMLGKGKMHILYIAQFTIYLNLSQDKMNFND